MSADPIVVGTNGTLTAKRAVDEAGELAAALGASLYVLMSYKLGSVSTGLAASNPVWVDPVATSETLRAHAVGVVTAAANRLERLGVKVWPHVCVGEPAEELTGLATDVGAQMIVVGNKGMGGARRILGSVPNRVSHHADCSVLLVHTC